MGKFLYTGGGGGGEFMFKVKKRGGGESITPHVVEHQKGYGRPGFTCIPESGQRLFFNFLCPTKAPSFAVL